MNHHGRHDGGEGERGESRPYDPPIAPVAVHLGQDIAENIGDREEQHPGHEGPSAEYRHFYRGYLGRSDQI